ncbi:MAG: metallophosphoesterase [Phycisphaerae bacterium]|nr:metallophosphoesterase [Phycisphaerae bacterium]
MIFSHLSLRVLGLSLSCALVSEAVETPSLSALPQLRIVGGPYLQAPSPTGMTLVWTTNNKCVSRVEYGPSADDMPHVAVSARHGLIDANTTLHRIALRGLRPGTSYAYRVISTEILDFKPYKVRFGPSVRAEGRFTTLDPEKPTSSFCVLTDRHDRAPALRQALGSVQWDGVDLVFGVGDVMNDPMTEQQIFQNFLDPCTEFFAGRIPLVFVRGNHETRGALARDLMDYFPTASGRYYYTFHHGGVCFLLLDGGEDKADTSDEYSGLVAFDDYIREQTEWLERELRSAAFREARFRVCLLHIPPVVPQERQPDKFIRAPWIRDNWSPMLSKAGIDLMISGHTHRYAELPANEERAFPIVVGGTNTVIRVDVSPERLRLTTFNDDGTVLSRPPEALRKR